MSRFDRWSDVRTIFPSGPQAHGDAPLIAAARTGDADAYAELTERHTDAARRLARLLVPTDEADALVSEAFAKVKLVLQRGDGPDLAFRPYLLTAVRRLHVDHGATAPESGGPDDAAAARAFTSLAEPWRMVLWHTEVEGESPDQVAVLLGEPAESVPPLIARAREGMRIAWLTMHEPAAGKECEWTRHNLGAYVRKVSFDRDTARVERHLEECEGCTAISLQLTQGSSDLRAILAPLVLGAAAESYLATTKSAKAPRKPRKPARVAARRTAAIGGIAAVFSSIASAPASAASRVGDQLARAKDFAVHRTAAAAVAGVAAVAVIAGGTFIVVQTADGPLEASAEAPRGLVLDDNTTEAGDPETSGDPSEPGSSDIGDAASASRSESASDDPSDSESSSPSDDATEEGTDGPSDNPTQNPTGPGRPSEQPSGHPTQQPTRPPTQQPTQPPTQEPTQPPTQAPAPPTDLSISATTSDLVGLLWGIDVRITGLAAGGTATLRVETSSGSIGMDGRCSGGTCHVTETPSTYRFRTTTLLGRSRTVTFTVYPDGDADANTSDNSTSVTVG